MRRRRCGRAAALMLALAPLLAGLWGLLPGAQAADQLGGRGGQPLACIGQQTYFPRGEKWALAPTGRVSLRYQSGGPSRQTGNIAIPASIANNAVAAAFGMWTTTTCDNPPGSLADIRFVRGADVSARNNGDRGADYNNVIWWAIDANGWLADAATLAVTTTSSYVDTGFVVNADMALNGFQFNWRTTDSGTGNAYGCNAANANCFDITSVAAHEVGHFIGFNHTSCTASLMYPDRPNTYVATGLSAHEKAGMCALYPPATGSGSGSGNALGQSCVSSADCRSGLTCVLPAGVQGSRPLGICSAGCSSSTDCPLAYVCKSIGAYGNVCTPGVHLPGIAPQVASPIADLCRPCADGSVCLSGFCGIPAGASSGYCTQKCAAPSYGCPEDFSCTAATQSVNLCWPIVDNLCATTYTGQPLNSACQMPASPTSSGFAVPCQDGLSCFVFANTSGYCVGACSSVDTSISCAASFTCCYGVDINGHCSPASTASSNGGCFQLRHAGESCVQANQSICDGSTQCFFAEDPTLAKCYNTCANGSCADGAETCVDFSTSLAGSGPKVCCQTKTFAPGDLATCVPNPGPCPRQTGVACNVNADCASLNCLKYNGGAACSIACSTNNDCPAASADVNDDGVADGGSSCLPVSSSTMCWPNRGPLPLPACAIVAAPGAAEAGCGGCAGGAGGGHAWAALLAVGTAWRLRRRP